MSVGGSRTLRFPATANTLGYVRNTRATTLNVRSDIDEVQKNDCQYVFCIVHDLHVYLSAADDGKYHRHKVKYVSVSKEKNAANNAE